MSRRRYSNTIHVSAEVDLSEVLDDALEAASDEELRSELNKRNALGSVPRGEGDADIAYARSIVMRAEMAARRMRDLPREIHDLFWHVHGVAL